MAGGSRSGARRTGGKKRRVPAAIAPSTPADRTTTKDDETTASAADLELPVQKVNGDTRPRDPEPDAGEAEAPATPGRASSGTDDDSGDSQAPDASDTADVVASDPPSADR